MAAIDRDMVLPPLPGLSNLQIVAGRVSADVVLTSGSGIKSLTLHGPFDDERTHRMLDQMPSVTSLHLDNSRAGTGVIEWIRSHPDVTYVNLTKTEVSADELARLREASPQTRVHG